MTSLKKILDTLRPKTVFAHCDAPCGVYDPASARVAAEAVYTLTKKITELEKPSPNEGEAHRAYLNTLVRYIAIKEEQAEIAKRELLILWTDYFKPPHVEVYPELHEIFWKAAKLCSTCKQEVSLEHAQELLDAVEKVHEIFWKTKGKDVPWITAAV